MYNCIPYMLLSQVMMDTPHLYTANTAFVNPGMDLSCFSNNKSLKKKVFIFSNLFKLYNLYNLLISFYYNLKHCIAILISLFDQFVGFIYILLH